MTVPAEVTFRDAVRADAECIGVLGTQVFLDTYATDGIRPSLAREVLAHLSTGAIIALQADAATRFIVAEKSGHMIGFAQLTMGAIQECVPWCPAAELNRLYVQERFTSRGVGAALLERAETFAADEGAAALWLTAWIGNRRALDFYPKRGYRELGATMFAFQGEEYENRVFAKALVSSSE